MNEIIVEINSILKETSYDIIQKKIVKLYFNIGKFIINNKFDVYDLEDILRDKYGLLIGFTRRNIFNMIKFYEKYKEYNIEVLSNISWDNHLIIIKQKNYDELIDYCLKYNIDKYNLKKIIKNGFDIKYNSVNKMKNDVVTLEIINYICSKKN